MPEPAREDLIYDWNLVDAPRKPTQKAIRSASPDSLSAMKFAAGSMGPKVDAACRFAKATGKKIQDLTDRYIALVDDVGGKKEKEILDV